MDTPCPTALELMKSRYSAYVLQLSDYLLKTWHSSKRPKTLQLAPTHWLGLDIISYEQGRPYQDVGFVEFIARYEGEDHLPKQIHERSCFIKENQYWYYVDGQIIRSS